MSENTPFEVTSFDVAEGLQELAQERPGVYERLDGSDSANCVNVEYIDGELVPSCIVGSYFSMRLGVENVEKSGDAHSTINDLLKKGLITITPQAEFMLNAAQRLQDTREVPWSAVANTMYGLKYAAELMHDKLNDKTENDD